MKFYLSIFLLLFLVQCEVLPSNYPVYRPNPNTSTGSNESQEYADLLAKDQINKKTETAKVLTYLLNDTEPEDKQTAAVIENSSNCNIIVRLVEVNGTKIYNLPIPRNGKNQFVIDKGNYTLKSNICTAKYYTQKYIYDPLILKLGTN